VAVWHRPACRFTCCIVLYTHYTATPDLPAPCRVPSPSDSEHTTPCGQMLSACTKLESDKAVDLWLAIRVPLDQCYYATIPSQYTWFCACACACMTDGHCIQYPSYIHTDAVLLDLHSACPATYDLKFRNPSRLAPIAFHRRRQRVHHPHDPVAGTPAAPCIIGARVAAV